jgi:hypothetical protein
MLAPNREEVIDSMFTDDFDDFIYDGLGGEVEYYVLHKPDQFSQFSDEIDEIEQAHIDSVFANL